MEIKIQKSLALSRMIRRSIREKKTFSPGFYKTEIVQQSKGKKVLPSGRGSAWSTKVGWTWMYMTSSGGV